MLQKNFSTTILAILFLVAAISAGYYYNLNKNLLAKTNPQAQQADDSKQVIDSVSKLILLPEEAPTIATVTDPKLLASQPFFANTKTGDRVLFFPAAHKVIIYDPKANIIVDVGSISISKQTQKPAPATASSTESKK